MDAATMRAALDIMHDLGMVACFGNIQVGRGRPVTIWRAAPALAAGNALDRLVEAYKP
jgi:hypothetical protein